MRQYLIDTSVLTAALMNRRVAVELLSPWIARGEAATSILVYGEIVEYISGFPDFERRHDQVLAMLRDVPPFFLTLAILRRYAETRRRMRPPFGSGLIGDIDTLIAATALDCDLTVVTTDSDFTRVPELSVHTVERTALRSR